MVVPATPEASSFGFLAAYGPLYLRLDAVADCALAVDPSLTLVSLRQLGQAFAKHAAGRAGLTSRDAPIAQVDLLHVLEQRGIVRDKIANKALAKGDVEQQARLHEIALGEIPSNTEIQARLAESRATGAPVDLAAIFTLLKRDDTQPAPPQPRPSDEPSNTSVLEK